MTPEQLIKELQKATLSGLKSVVLYGSAAAGDHVGERSDYNVLVVLEKLGTEELKALAPPSIRWVRAGNPPPLLFTFDRLQSSADVFPIELLDIRDAHQILEGEDVISKIDIRPENLRLQLEHELKAKLIKLRERYLMAEGKERKVVDLMIDSLSSFLVLFRAALRLFEPHVPAQKMDALRALNRFISFDKQVFDQVFQLKEGSMKRKEVEVDALFGRYLSTIEQIVDAVDSFIRPTEEEA